MTAKILIADDDPFNSSLLKGQLDRIGFTDIAIVEDGISALQAMRSTNYDLLLLDMQMPRMTGFEVLTELKSDLELHDIPVVVVSGEDDIDLVIKCIELGAEDYLDKPVNAGLLAARLRNVFERKRLQKSEEVQTEQLRAAKARSDELLEVILPPAVARQLRATGSVPARRYENVSILFCDVANFTSYCSDHTPEEVVGRLEALFGSFEEIANKHGLEKIKTIGDAFMAAASINIPANDPLHAAVSCGLEMMAVTDVVCPGWQTRVGVAEGPVVAGIVGKDKFQFDIWGDTVNVAARMVAVGRCGVVTMPQECWQKSTGQYVGKMLGEVEVKGKGVMRIVECAEMRERLVG